MVCGRVSSSCFIPFYGFAILEECLCIICLLIHVCIRVCVWSVWCTCTHSHSSGTSAEANHEQSPDTGSEQVASTPPPVPVERSESVFSSASKHYLSLSRLNSIFPVSRSSSESLSASTPVLPIIKNRVDSIHENIGKMERVRSYMYVCVNVCMNINFVDYYAWNSCTIESIHAYITHDICINLHVCTYFLPLLYVRACIYICVYVMTVLLLLLRNGKRSWERTSVLVMWLHMRPHPCTT